MDPGTENDIFRIREKLSHREEEFEKKRKTHGLFLGPAVFFLLYMLPLELSPKAHTLAAVIGWVVVWWMSEAVPIPVTAVFAAVICVILGIADAKAVFAPFADPLIFLFLGSFVLSKAMSVHNLDKRFAYGIISLKWVGNSSARILFVFGAICAFVSMWISNTATCAMMYPVALGIVFAMSNLISERTGKEVDPSHLRYGTGMMLMAAYASSAGGIGTPVGSPPNLIGIALIERFAFVKIPFFQWMVITVPMLLLLYVFLFLILFWMHRPEISQIKGTHEFVSKERDRLGKWTRGQKNSLAAFSVTVVLWIIPGILSLVLGTEHAVSRSYSALVPEGVAAMIGAVLLFLLPVDWKKREFTIKWKQAVNIDWGTLLIFGAGISLSSMMFETKLAESIGEGLLGLSGAGSVWTVTLAAIYIAIVVSEATSNTASANMIVPVMISLCLAANINPVPPAIGATIGASWGFMLPVSTPPNAIVYGSGFVPITKMIRTGFIFDIIGGLIIWVVLRIMLPLTGLA